MVTFTPLQKEEKMKKLSQFLKDHILEMSDTIQLNFGKWDTDNGGHL